MSLPDGGRSPWPPEPARPALRLIREWSAWWSADPANLIAVYGSTVGGQATAMAPKNWFRRFWERIAGSGQSFGSPEGRQRAYLHVPLASDMAATSAALLFSEAPTIRIAAAHLAGATTVVKATEAELQRIRSEGGLDARLLEAADYAAGLGGVFLKPTWDQDLADYPLLEVVQPDQALPEFRHGILTAATLWREVDRTDKEVLRHLERHEVVDGRSFVLHALYRGDDEVLGTRMEDAELLAKVELEPSVELPFEGLGVGYVPNLRPNHRLRGSSLGEADYGGREGLLDALDEAYASWMRDIRLGKGRILVSRQMLDTNRRFDMDHEVYAPIEMPGASAGTPLKDQISAEQFQIRYEAHRDTCLTLTERIVSGPYSPQTFGLHIEGRAESGTALDIRERRTFMTQQRKAAWWGAAVATATEQMLIVARHVFNRPIESMRPSVELSDSVATDAYRTAETVDLLNRAEAASRRTLVEMQHPDWTREQVQVEVDAILAERGLAVAPPDEPPV
jgi:hypothetical protein